MSREEALEAVDLSESFSEPEKEVLFKLLKENLVELRRNFDNPKEILIVLTRKAISRLIQPQFV